MTEQENIFWKQFQRKIFIRAVPAEIFHTLATAAGLERWLLEKADFRENEGGSLGRNAEPGAGDHFAWKWHGSDSPARGRLSGLSRYLYVNYVFEDSHENISFRLDRHGEETLVTLTQQQDYPTEEENRRVYLATRPAWTFYLSNLKSVLEGGLDLREKAGRKEKDLVNGVTE